MGREDVISVKWGRGIGDAGTRGRDVGDDRDAGT